jgi:predicted dehydrogenase
MGSEHAKRIERAGGNVVAGTDVIADARDQFATRFDADVYEDWIDMYAADVDAVVITVPNAFHEEAAVAALDAGLDVLLEKPIAHDLASAKRIAAAARDAEGFCVSGFVMRFYPEVEELLARATAGEFGDVAHVEARYIRRNNVPDSGWFIDPDLAGGGALVDVGVHVLDVALAALGFPDVEGVYGRTRNECTKIDVEDSATALARTADGATVSLEVAWAANTDPGRAIVVRGNEGGARLDLGNETLSVYDDPEAGGDDPVTVETADHDWLAPEDEAFVEAVERGTPPDRGNIDEGLAVQRIINAIYASDETGELVSPSERPV